MFKVKVGNKSFRVQDDAALGRSVIEAALKAAVDGARPYVLGVPRLLRFYRRAEGPVAFLGRATLNGSTVEVSVATTTTFAGLVHTIAHELRHVSQHRFGHGSDMAAREVDAWKVGRRARRAVRGAVPDAGVLVLGPLAGARLAAQ